MEGVTLAPAVSEGRCTIRMNMKTWHVVALTLLCFVALQGQERRQTPSKATPTIIGPDVYKPGDTLKLILRLTPTPDGYHGGRVAATIVNTDRSTQANQPGEYLGEASAGESVPLEDGQSEYVFQFRIDEQLKSGEWKLGRVECGNAQITEIPVSDNVTFKVDTDEPPISVSVSGPKTVENGTKATFHVSIDKYAEPAAPGTCRDSLGMIFYPSEAGYSPSTARAFGESSTLTELKPGTVSYDVPFERLPDAPRTGKWVAEVLSYKSGQPKHPCPRPRKLVGEKSLVFEVLPAEGLVVPKSAQVTLNPSEVKLLQVQASLLRAKITRLRGELSEGNSEQSKQVLQQTVAEALQSVTETEEEYRKLAKSQSPASNVFFDDIRSNYHDSLLRLSTQRNSGDHLQLVSAAPAGSLDNVASFVIGSILHNVNAYETAASKARLTFTLRLRSDPEGAKIFYRRKPDEFQSFSDVTNSSIENLPIAVWFVKFQKDGYEETEEVPYDATTQTSPVFVKLKPVRGKRPR